MECEVYKIVVILTCFVLPVSAIFILYSIIHITVLKSRKKVAHLTNGFKTSSTGVTTSTSGGGGSLHNSTNTTQTITKISKMRNQIPWCIVFVVILYIVSTLPWLPMRVYPRYIQGVLKGKGYSLFVFDILYSSLLLCTALSPLAYLVTSQTLRRELVVILRHAKNRLLCR